ncbi:ankyrin repeat-containing domain protein [Paraphysoderma sedebokerense]|nr:ankyrin repeat-containing domain protein [Paraphysoderma sedebokerense]
MMVRDKQPSVGGGLSLPSQAPPTNPTGPISKLKRTNSVFTQVPQPILELCSAIQKQDTEAIDKVIQTKSQSLSLTTRITERGRTPLHLAVDSKSPVVVEKLLASDIPYDINIRDDKGITPIHVAVRGGSVEIIKLLMANGADPLVQDDTSNGNAPIHLAVKNFNCFLALVEGMDEEKLKEVMNFRDRKDWCLLHLASYHGVCENDFGPIGYNKLTAKVGNSNQVNQNC